MRTYRAVATWAAVGICGSAALAQSVTVASFSDPATSSATPMFVLAGTSFTGGWEDGNLDLVAPLAGTTYDEVHMTMTPLTWDGMFGLSGGTIWFSQGESLVLQIDFTSATLVQPFVFGASEFVAEDVTFSGPATNGLPLTSEQFAFSFANPMLTGNGATWTASFTSSATIVPEPASLVLLVMGAVASLKRPWKA